MFLSREGSEGKGVKHLVCGVRRAEARVLDEVRPPPFPSFHLCDELLKGETTRVSFGDPPEVSVQVAASPLHEAIVLPLLHPRLLPLHPCRSAQVTTLLPDLFVLFMEGFEGTPRHTGRLPPFLDRRHPRRLLPQKGLIAGLSPRVVGCDFPLPFSDASDLGEVDVLEVVPRGTRRIVTADGTGCLPRLKPGDDAGGMEGVLAGEGDASPAEGVSQPVVADVTDVFLLVVGHGLLLHAPLASDRSVAF